MSEKEKAKEYLSSPDYMTFKEASQQVGVHPLTFKKYATRLGIEGVAISKYTFYHQDDVKRIAKVTENNTPMWVRMIEHDTGRKVKEIIFED